MVSKETQEAPSEVPMCEAPILLDGQDPAYGKVGAQERGGPVEMSAQARKIEHEAIPQWAEGLYYSKGLSSEALVYYDDEAS
jgi:hypothetical protein